MYSWIIFEGQCPTYLGRLQAMFLIHCCPTCALWTIWWLYIAPWYSSNYGRCSRPWQTSTTSTYPRGIYETLRNLSLCGVCYQWGSTIWPARCICFEKPSLGACDVSGTTPCECALDALCIPGSYSKVNVLLTYHCCFTSTLWTMWWLYIAPWYSSNYGRCRRPWQTSTTSTFPRGIYETLRNLSLCGVCYQWGSTIWPARCICFEKPSLGACDVSGTTPCECALDALCIPGSYSKVNVLLTYHCCFTSTLWTMWWLYIAPWYSSNYGRCRRPWQTSTTSTFPRGIYETLRNLSFHGVCYQWGSTTWPARWDKPSLGACDVSGITPCECALDSFGIPGSYSKVNVLLTLKDYRPCFLFIAASLARYERYGGSISLLGIHQTMDVAEDHGKHRQWAHIQEAYSTGCNFSLRLGHLYACQVHATESLCQWRLTLTQREYHSVIAPRGHISTWKTLCQMSYANSHSMWSFRFIAPAKNSKRVSPQREAEWKIYGLVAARFSHAMRVSFRLVAVPCNGP